MALSSRFPGSSGGAVCLLSCGSCYPNCYPNRRVEEVRRAEPVIDQVDVGPERDAGVGVPEPHLHLLGVLAAGEQDRRAGPCGSSQECNFPVPIKIPPGHWFMMGDNRGESDDSRFWGPVPTGWIIGPAH